MNITMSKRILRWLQPKAEENRIDFRMRLANTMAKGEDITRTIKGLNGHLCDHPAIKNALKK